MPAPILAAKLYTPPARPGVVPRPRLMGRLNEGANGRLALISAPAGFGKTTLVSEWIAACGRPAAWLSLDEGDSDPVRLVTYLIAALQTIQRELGGGLLAALQSPQSPSIESILTLLLNEIGAVQSHFVFVFDDYHVIDAQPVDEALTFLLDHLPPQMHLVIATREDPSLPLARYRARGQLTELRAADLRFTPEEAIEFLNRAMGLSLSEGDVAALEARTEGWIAGLQLAALSMQGRSDVSRFIQTFTGSHRFVLDYLVEEVLQRQPEAVRSFLLQTAILGWLCASLCDAVTGRGDGKELLEALERGNLFIIPLDDQRQWYRYHPLFAEALQARLLDEQAEQVCSLHRRASEWYEQHGAAADAIRHALAAKDFERAAALVELAIPNMRRNRQEAKHTELGWLKALPDDLVQARPVLSVAYAYALFGDGELETVETHLRGAERWLDAAANSPSAGAAGMVVVDEEEFRRLPGMIALLRTAQALARGDMPEAVKNARRVLDAAPKNDYLMLGGAASTLGLAAWTAGDLDAARGMTAEGMANVRRAGYTSSAIGGALVLADIQIAQSRLREAMSTYEQGLRWAAEPGAPVLRGAADMHAGMGDLYYEYNDLSTALQHLLTSQSLGEQAGLPQYPYRWCAAMARIRQAQGSLDEALALLDKAERLYEANFSPNMRPIAARKVWLWLAQGRLDKALAWAREMGLSADDDLTCLRAYEHITLARVLLARYQSGRERRFIQDAMALLERLLKAAEAGSWMGCVIEILVLQALAYHAQGDLGTALVPLQRALALAEPEGYVRIFIDQGEAMRPLLAKQSQSRDHPLSHYVDKLLAAFPQPAAAEKPAVIHQKSELTEPLSERELEVLKLLRSELSGPEIARQLSVSINTFRTHTKNIYLKLGVNDRRAAIRRAEELDLI